MSLATDARGLKRICDNCGTRFYDMNKRPIECPECKTEFTGEPKVKSRRGRAAEETKTPEVAANDKKTEEKEAKAVEAVEEDELEEEETELQEVSLDDVAVAESAEEGEDEATTSDDLPDLGDAELEVDLDASDDVTLESDLDGDLEEDLGDVAKASGGDDA